MPMGRTSIPKMIKPGLAVKPVKRPVPIKKTKGGK
jgi:hypothetical protein